MKKKMRQCLISEDLLEIITERTYHFPYLLNEQVIMVATEVEQ